MAKKIDKEKKRQALIEAACRVLSKKGAGETKIEDIAIEANVAKGTIYLYFKNKEEIFHSILTQHISDREQDLHQLLKAEGDPREKLKNLMLGFVEQAQVDSYPPQFHYEIISAMLRSDSKTQFTKGITRGQMAIASLIIQMNIEDMDKAKAVNIAVGLLGLLHGLKMMSALSSNHDTLQNIIQTMLDQLFG